MCKYCEYRDVREWNDGTFEKTNEMPRIMRVEDGHQIFELNLNRYTVEREDHCHHELIFEVVGKDRYSGHEYTILDTHIDIKYCPFCGEKL